MKEIKIIDSFFELENLENNCIKNRFLKLFWFLGMFLILIIMVIGLITYFLLGLFIMDWIYWVFSNKTILWQKLMD